MYYIKSSVIGKFLESSVTKSPSGHHVFSTTAYLFISVIKKSIRLKTYIIIVAYMHMAVNTTPNAPSCNNPTERMVTIDIFIIFGNIKLKIRLDPLLELAEGPEPFSLPIYS